MILGVHWKDWCWNWNSNTSATSCEELTHWKRPWCWEGSRAGGEGDDRGWDDWMASLTRWTWVWVNSRSWWWTGRPGVLQLMVSQRVRHDWATELKWTELNDSSLARASHKTMTRVSVGRPHKGTRPVQGGVLFSLPLSFLCVCMCTCA